MALGTRNRLRPKDKSPFASDAFSSVAFTVGAEAANVIKVTASLKKPRNKQASGQVKVFAWLTQNTTSLAVAAVAPSGTVVVAAKGAILVSPTAKTIHHIVTDSNGEFDLNISEAGVATWYLCVQLPDGSVARSAAITFA